MTVFQRYQKNEDGAVAVIFSLTALVLFSVSGLALDVGRSVSERQKLAAAADAAALAGASTAGDARVESAKVFFAVHEPSVTPEIESTSAFVRVTASKRVPTLLMGALGFPQMTVSVESIAGSSYSSSAPTTLSGACIHLLEPSNIGLYVNSDSKLNANCGVQVNSAHSTEALFVNSKSSVLASSVRVHGRSRLNSSSTVSSLPIDGSPRIPDPLAALVEPTNANAACNHIDFTVNNGEARVMHPGVYCKKTLINSGSSATMMPGTYVFRDGPFEINSLSKVNGDGVMMFFKNKDAYLKVNSDSTFRVSAPTLGGFSGVLMFQSRDLGNSSAPPFIVNSNGNTKMEGTIYLPRGTLEVNSHSNANQDAAYTAIVARNMVLNSFGTLMVSSNYDGLTPLPTLLSAPAVETVTARLTK